MSESNYDSALELLKGRFGKPQQIITAYMDELLRILACANEHPASLRPVYDKINVQMTKISNEIQLRIARESRTDVWKLDELMKVMRDKVEVCEASEGSKVNLLKPPVSHNHRENPGLCSLPSVSTLVSNEFHVQFIYCDGSHYMASWSNQLN